MLVENLTAACWNYQGLLSPQGIKGPKANQDGHKRPEGMPAFTPAAPVMLFNYEPDIIPNKLLYSFVHIEPVADTLLARPKQ